MNQNTLTSPALLNWNPAAQFASASKLLNISTTVMGRLVELNVSSFRRQNASNVEYLKSLAKVRDFSSLVETQRQFLQSAWQAQEESMKTACKVVQQGIEDARTAIQENPVQTTVADRQPVIQARPTTSARTAPEVPTPSVKAPSPSAPGFSARQTSTAPSPSTEAATSAAAPSRVHFEIYQDKAGEYRFRLQGADGRTLLRSEGYRKRRGAVNGVNAVKKNASNDARYDRQTSPTGKPSFNLKAGNHQVIGSSRTFSSAAQMDTAIELIKETAPASSVRDLTGAA